MKEPLIFDIKRSSTADGPGIRTVVFFKGCNLDCFWCHNPEGKGVSKERVFFKEKCIGCGSCREMCENDDKTCTVCGKCEETCPTGAIKIYGKPYTVSELFDIIKRDKAYFDATGGGVTFSGGECMLYPEYLSEIAEKCHERGISVAIDTAGCVPRESFERVLPYADIFLYDVKALDSELHKKGTGKDNTLILDNLDFLISSGKKIIIRVPIIPGFNEGDEVERVKKYAKNRGLSCELLPYHTFGDEKRRALIESQNISSMKMNNTTK